MADVTQHYTKELLSTESRYNMHTNVVKYDNKLMFDIPYRVENEEAADDQYFVVTSEFVNRLDKVASKYYNNPKYWWVIANINNIGNPFDLPVGTLLRITSLNKLIMDGVIS